MSTTGCARRFRPGIRPTADHPDTRRLGVPGLAFVNKGGSAGEGPRARSADAPQGRIAGVGELCPSKRGGAGNAPSAPQFAEAYRQGTNQSSRSHETVVRVCGGTISQQPRHSCGRGGLGRGTRQRHHGPVTRTLLGTLRQRAKHLRRPVFRPCFESAPSGLHLPERPNGSDRTPLEAVDQPCQALILFGTATGDNRTLCARGSSSCRRWSW